MPESHTGTDASNNTLTYTNVDSDGYRHSYSFSRADIYPNANTHTMYDPL